MLTPEQSKEIKKQLIAYVEKLYPGEKELLAKEINSMNEQQLELFLKQNNIKLKSTEEKSSEDNKSKIPEKPSCIFCAISQGETPSFKIDENKDSVAVLDINPASQGHILIIPKKHSQSTEQIPKSAFSLAQKISKKLKSKLKPKEITITSSNSFGHAIINIIPIYNEENINSERKPASKQELEELQKKLQKIKKSPSIKKPKTKQIDIPEKKLWLPKKIPR